MRKRGVLHFGGNNLHVQRLACRAVSTPGLLVCYNVEQNVVCAVGLWWALSLNVQTTPVDSIHRDWAMVKISMSDVQQVTSRLRRLSRQTLQPAVCMWTDGRCRSAAHVDVGANSIIDLDGTDVDRDRRLYTVGHWILIMGQAAVRRLRELGL